MKVLRFWVEIFALVIDIFSEAVLAVVCLQAERIHGGHCLSWLIALPTPPSRRPPRGTGPRPGERSAPSGSPPDPLALTAFSARRAAGPVTSVSSRRLLAGDPECDRGAALGAPLPVGAAGGAVPRPGRRRAASSQGPRCPSGGSLKGREVSGIPSNAATAPARQCRLLVEEVSSPASRAGPSS